MENEFRCKGKYSCKVKVASVFIGSKMLCLLDASKVDDALALVTDLSDTLEDRTLEVRLHALFLFLFLFIASTPVRKRGPSRAFMRDSEI